MENSESLLKKAILLKPQDRFLLIDELIRSLDQPNREIDAIWAEEAEKRLKAHREGKTVGIPYEEVFGEKLGI
jgi:putative addiction module component (TIGR02574 family)